MQPTGIRVPSAANRFVPLRADPVALLCRGERCPGAGAPSTIYGRCIIYPTEYRLDRGATVLSRCRAKRGAAAVRRGPAAVNGFKRRDPSRRDTTAVIELSGVGVPVAMHGV